MVRSPRGPRGTPLRLPPSAERTGLSSCKASRVCASWHAVDAIDLLSEGRATMAPPATTVLPVLQRRRSVRRFVAGWRIPDDDLITILEAGRLPPSGTDCQPWRFVVVRDRGRLGQLAQATAGRDTVNTAGCVVACFADLLVKSTAPEQLSELEALGALSRSEVGVFGARATVQTGAPRREAKAVRDVGVAVYGMMLQATALGIGSCWLAVDDAAAHAYEVPPGLREHYAVVCILALGRPGGGCR